jgi:N-acetylglucosaminyldiphosphoundecaprenol N-acetyl-beta-D-mannosaminyltransferase
MSARLPDPFDATPNGLSRFDFATVSGRDTGAGGSITITAPDRGVLLADLDRLLRAGQGFSLATLNLDHLVKIGRDPVFARAYAAQTHVTADGNPIVWLCAMAGQEVELIPGSELVNPVAGLAAEAGVSVALLGSTDAALAAAGAALVASYPSLQIAAQIAPPMGFDPGGAAAQTAIAELGASGAGLCFLALGAPKQEIFAAHAQDALPGMGFLSIGAGLDFLAGSQTRAPKIVRRLALEWLWRLMANPRRLSARYASCFAILPRAMATARQARPAPRGRRA